MSNLPGQPNSAPLPGNEEVTCPKCGHKFWHNVREALKKAAEGLGEAIGEAKFDQ